MRARRTGGAGQSGKSSIEGCPDRASQHQARRSHKDGPFFISAHLWVPYSPPGPRQSGSPAVSTLIPQASLPRYPFLLPSAFSAVNILLSLLHNRLLDPAHRRGRFPGTPLITMKLIYSNGQLWRLSGRVRLAHLGSSWCVIRPGYICAVVDYEQRRGLMATLKVK